VQGVFGACDHQNVTKKIPAAIGEQLLTDVMPFIRIKCNFVFFWISPPSIHGGESIGLAGDLDDEDLWKDNADVLEKVRSCIIVVI